MKLSYKLGAVKEVHSWHWRKFSISPMVSKTPCRRDCRPQVSVGSPCIQCPVMQVWLWYSFLSDSSSKAMIVRGHQRAREGDGEWFRQSVWHTFLLNLWYVLSVKLDTAGYSKGREDMLLSSRRLWPEYKERRLAVMTLSESNSSLKVPMAVVLYRMACTTQDALCSYTSVSHSEIQIKLLWFPPKTTLRETPIP